MARALVAVGLLGLVVAVLFAAGSADGAPVAGLEGGSVGGAKGTLSDALNVKARLAEVEAAVKSKGDLVADLHVHTSYSDGLVTPKQLVERAASDGVHILSFTDYSTLSFEDDVLQAAIDQNVVLVPGVEISCEWKLTSASAETLGKQSVGAHVLGYLVDHTDAALQSLLLANRERKQERTGKIYEYLNSIGVAVREEDVLDVLTPDTYIIGRRHIARVLVDKGIASTITEAFQLYLSDEKVALGAWPLSCDEAVETLHGAGGVSVLAHPHTLGLSKKQLAGDLAAFTRRTGLQGLECFVPEYDPEYVSFLEALAQSNGLLITGGSSFHGDDPDDAIGDFGQATEAWRRRGGVTVPLLLRQRERQTSYERVMRNLVIYVLLVISLASSVLFLRPRMTDPHPTGLAYTLQSIPCLEWCFSTDMSLPRHAGGGGGGGGGGGSGAKAEFDYKTLALYVAALQTAYLTWGYMQERVVTIDYDGERFVHTEFLVFFNRAFGLVLAFLVTRGTWFAPRPTSAAPPYAFAFSSMSNILSAWFQYEALKFVSFPMQVVAKSSKILCAMVMGRAMSNKTFPPSEYVAAGLISVGVVVFRLGQTASGGLPEEGANYFIIGLLLLLAYAFSDSFTSNWQSRIFSQHKISPLQMMLGTNAISASFSFVMLLLSGELWPAVGFLLKHNECLVHVTLTAVCSAVGSIFIFKTIATYGAVVFATIMTFRQLLAIGISMIAFNHGITTQGYLGLALVFAALGYRIMEKRKKSNAPRAEKQ